MILVNFLLNLLTTTSKIVVNVFRDARRA